MGIRHRLVSSLYILCHRSRLNDGELGVLHCPKEVDEEDGGRDYTHCAEGGQHRVVILLVHAYNADGEEESEPDHVGHQLLQFN